MPLKIELRELGGPEKLIAVEVPAEPLKAGELRVRHTAIGFNYLDVYLRTGVYKMPLPAVLGVEAAGVVTEVGEGVTGFAVGDRIAYGGPDGAYTSERTISADEVVPVPADVSDEAAAALLFKGLTAHMLLRRVYPVGKGDTILVQSAAGGVGVVTTRWAKALGATVIGTVGSRAKVDIARRNGCDHVAVLGEDDVAAMAKDVTGGVGVSVVYDAVGRDTFEDSLKSLRPFGVMASYGQASGEVPAIEAQRLSNLGSLFFVRPNVYRHVAKPADYRAAAAEVLDLIRNGTLQADIGQRFALTDVAEAHRQAEARKTTGSTLLIP
ncbi:MAG TPA: quinone oxidoreductase [Azospirillaceae bacterium]|nr:quinone oxidoreductase [Azospirillaceae bacterium]